MSRPEPSADSAETRARDEVATAALVATFLATRGSRAAHEALELRTLAAAAALVQEQRGRLTTRSSLASDLPARTMVAELATAARVSERTIQRQLSDASDLCVRFPVAVDALGEGRISRAHVTVIHEAGFPIEDDDVRDEFVRMMVDRAETMTPARLRPIAELRAARMQPRSLAERHEGAQRERAVRVIDLSDGMAELRVAMSAVLAHGVHDRLTAQAHAVIAARPDAIDAEQQLDADGAGDSRSMDQLRTDILCDLLLTGTPETCTAGEGTDAIRATVQITLPVLTAIGVGDEPALLAGYGPIDTETARRLAVGATGWERVMTSPITGGVLAVDRYHPSKAMKRFLRARDERCRFPGCRQAVWRCDLDHTIDAALGGSTDCGNLAHLCRRHHVLKHNSAWKVRQLDDGVLEWTSPTGRVHEDLSEPVVRFSPSDPEFDRRRPDTWHLAPDDDPPVF